MLAVGIIIVVISKDKRQTGLGMIRRRTHCTTTQPGRGFGQVPSGSSFVANLSIHVHHHVTAGKIIGRRWGTVVHKTCAVGAVGEARGWVGDGQAAYSVGG